MRRNTLSTLAKFRQTLCVFVTARSYTSLRFLFILRRNARFCANAPKAKIWSTFYILVTTGSITQHENRFFVSRARITTEARLKAILGSALRIFCTTLRIGSLGCLLGRWAADCYFIRKSCGIQSMIFQGCLCFFRSDIGVPWMLKLLHVYFFVKVCSIFIVWRFTTLMIFTRSVVILRVCRVTVFWFLIIMLCIWIIWRIFILFLDILASKNGFSTVNVFKSWLFRKWRRNINLCFFRLFRLKNHYTFVFLFLLCLLYFLSID